MLDIQLKGDRLLRRFLAEQETDIPIQINSPEEKVRLLIVRDLMRLGWEMTLRRDRVLFKPPDSYDKQIIKDSMQIKRLETIAENINWITNHIELARENLAAGNTVWNSGIEPIIETCETQEQLDIFRIFRFYWSSPYSEYVGRRIKLLIRDGALPNRPIMGIAALGSSIIHIPERDDWIGWDKETRTKNLIYAMDAYVLGALPPYNCLLGGKLISYLMASNDVREIYQHKYKDAVTNITSRTANDLACIFTTSLYGKSSQYNRVKYKDDLLYIPIGQTKGYGTLHLTNETFEAMLDLLDAHKESVTNRFGDGPSWRMRVIRTAANILGFDSDFLLRHSFQRQIYVLPLAQNFKEFLKGEDESLQYYDYPQSKLVDYWKERWLYNRKASSEVRESVHDFQPDDFVIA